MRGKNHVSEQENQWILFSMQSLRKDRINAKVWLSRAWEWARWKTSRWSHSHITWIVHLSLASWRSFKTHNLRLLQNSSILKFFFFFFLLSKNYNFIDTRWHWKAWFQLWVVLKTTSNTDTRSESFLCSLMSFFYVFSLTDICK